MNFVSAFSTGKDSMLALHRMVSAGHTPIGLIVIYNPNAGRSWFHGIDRPTLEKIAASLEIPLYCYETDGTDYNETMERALTDARENGAEACIFGDIDIDGHAEWNRERCEKAGIEALMPLWQENREDLAKAVVDAGYQCVIKCLHPEQLPESFLGRCLSHEVFEEMKTHHIDVCGENGEYHTVVLDGPLFKQPITYTLGEILELEHVSAIEIFVE